MPSALAIAFLVDSQKDEYGFECVPIGGSDVLDEFLRLVFAFLDWPKFMIGFLMLKPFYLLFISAM